MTAASIAVERSSIAKTAQSKDKPDKPYEVRADKPMGLLLRVQPSGTRTFYVQVERGKRVRIGPAGTFTLKQAEERAKAILRDPDATKRITGQGITVQEYLDDHYRDHALAQLKTGKETINRIETVWSKFLNKRVSDLNASEIDRFRNKRILEGLAPATVNRDVSALSGMLTHWVKNNKGTIHPLADMQALEVPDDETVRYLTPDEGNRLRKALADRDTQATLDRENANLWREKRGYELLPEIKGYSDHITPMVLISLNTGVRQGELFAMQWEFVDLERRNLTVLASHSKGSRTRNIPLNAEACSVFAAIKPTDAKGLVFASPITDDEFDNVNTAWENLIKVAEIPDLRWHDLRHDFASQLVMKGVSLYVVQQLMGHSTAKQTQRYARLAPSHLSDAVRLLDAVGMLGS